MSEGIEVIQREHRNYDRVLAALEAAVARLPERGPKPGLELLASVIYYIRVFPEKLHHPKEEQYLFAPLRRRCPDAAALLDELEAQHHEGGELIERVDRALQAYERDEPGGRAALQQAARAFVEMQRRHIGLEERELLPLARERLSEAEKRAMDGAFAKNTDPLFGENLEAGFRALFERITRDTGGR